MDTPPVISDISHLVIVTPQQKLQIRQHYNLTQEIIDRDVDTLVSWFRQQPHLPKHDLDRGWVERMFIMNKCSMERTKEKLDMIFAAKTILPQFFSDVEINSCIASIENNAQWVPLPRLHRDNTRLIVIRPLETGSDSYNLEKYLKYSFAASRYRSTVDYSMGIRIIYDPKHLCLAHILKTYPATLKQGEWAFKKFFGGRISAIHVVNTSAFLEMVLSLLKTTLKPKLAARIILHPSLEDLHQHIDKDILPEDYGGTLKSCNSICDDWHRHFRQKDIVEWFQRLSVLQSDETKRPGKQLDNELLGVTGSFRTLNVD